jgi:solute carrier family 35 protein F5
VLTKLVCHAGTLLVTLSDDSSSGGSSSNVRGSSLAAMTAGSNATSALPAGAMPGSSGGSSGPSHSVWGDMLCLVSAAFYACYTIVLRKALPDDDEANVALFFGYVGLLCSVVFAPVVAVLAGVGALHIKAIPSKAYLIILVQGAGCVFLGWLWAVRFVLIAGL